MLQNLHVKNLALIHEADVEFDQGLNILSGETGAGKSIIIGSMNLALGEKVPKEMLRSDADSAIVEMIFQVDKESTREKLKALDIELEDDLVILSRKISSGRAIGRINGETVSTSKMKEVAALLIDIYGQHEGQTLTSKKKQLEILDDFGKLALGNKKELLAQSYKSYRKLKEEYASANLDISERQRELSLLEYEVNEIIAANLLPGEDEELEEKFHKYSNGKKIMEAANIAYAAVGGEDGCASERIGRALRELSFVSEYDKPLAELEQMLGEIDNLVSDFNHELSGYIADTEFDGEEFYNIEKRLDEINHLKSKYGDSILTILEELDKKQKRLEQLSDYDRYLNQLLTSIEKEEKQLRNLCDEVSQIRKTTAEKLCESIRNALMDLNFLDVRFDMEFRTLDDYTANGLDDAEFIISTNPGEPMKPLGKIASGGELSRISLAMKTVMAESDDIDTLIFDEIDSGISGRTAQMVSEKMNELGRNHQIICITHLPQIAAMADTHFLIEKSVHGDVTESNIKKLNTDESVSELARMLGGVEVTDTVMESAKEMKQLAYMKK